MRLSALLFRLAIAAGLTMWLLWRSRPDEVVAALANVSWPPIALALLFVLVDRVLMAWRWLQLLCIVEPQRRPPLGALIQIFLVSTFLGTFLPASVGSDAVRAWHLSKLEVSGADSVASVLLDRMSGLASLLLMALAGLFLARDLAGNAALLVAMAAATLACATVLAVVVSRRAAAGVLGLLSRVPGRLGSGGHGLIISLRRYEAFLPQLLAVLIGSVTVQVLRILQAWCLGQALGITAPLAAYFAFVPLIVLVMLLPVTINGIGTGQAAFVWLFARVGVSEPLAFTLSVLFVALGLVGNLPGGILYAAGVKPRRA